MECAAVVEQYFRPETAYNRNGIPNPSLCCRTVYAMELDILAVSGGQTRNAVLPTQSVMSFLGLSLRSRAQVSKRSILLGKHRLQTLINGAYTLCFFAYILGDGVFPTCEKKIIRCGKPRGWLTMRTVHLPLCAVSSKQVVDGLQKLDTQNCKVNTRSAVTCV